jgi:hypothetical protein
MEILSNPKGQFGMLTALEPEEILQAWEVTGSPNPSGIAPGNKPTNIR